MRAGLLSAPAPQARVGLELADHRHEVVEADDALELEAGAFVGGPDAISLDAADYRQTNDHAVAATHFGSLVNHEPMGGNVADVQRHVAAQAMLADDRMVDRMPSRTALVRHRKLRTAHLATFLPLFFVEGGLSQQMLEKG